MIVRKISLIFLTLVIFIGAGHTAGKLSGLQVRFYQQLEAAVNEGDFDQTKTLLLEHRLSDTKAFNLALLGVISFLSSGYEINEGHADIFSFLMKDRKNLSKQPNQESINRAFVSALNAYANDDDFYYILLAMLRPNRDKFSVDQETIDSQFDQLFVHSSKLLSDFKKYMLFVNLPSESMRASLESKNRMLERVTRYRAVALPTMRFDAFEQKIKSCSEFGFFRDEKGRVWRVRDAANLETFIQFINKDNIDLDRRSQTEIDPVIVFNEPEKTTVVYSVKAVKRGETRLSESWLILEGEPEHISAANVHLSHSSGNTTGESAVDESRGLNIGNSSVQSGSTVAQRREAIEQQLRENERRKQKNKGE